MLLKNINNMGTKIQINSLEALERLIGGNSEIEIEIRNAIIQEFAKKHLKGIAAEEYVKLSEIAIRKEIKDEYFIETKPNGSWNNSVLSFNPKVLSQIKDELRLAAREEVRKIISETINIEATESIIQNKLTCAANDIVDRLSDIVLTNKLDKLVETRVKEKLGLK